MFGKNKVAALVAEFLGTGVLTLVVLAVQRSTIGIPYFVALAAGLTVAAMTLVFAMVSGAHFNPAITLGAFATRKINVLKAASFIVVQLLGAWAAYGLYTYFVNSSLQVIGGHYTARILTAEAVGAFVFAFVWAAASAQRLAASVVGAGLTLGLLVAAVASVGIINPAVALGVRAWVVSDFTHWVGWGTYALGPVIGGVLGFVAYEVVFGNGLAFAMASSSRVSSGASTTTATRVAAPKTRKSPAKKTTKKRK